MLIDGKWVQAKSGKLFDVHDPATEMRWPAWPKAMPPISTRRCARRARRWKSGPWSRMSPSARGRLIHKIGDLILENLDELAQLESLDNGKPFSVARVADVPLAADMFHYMSGWATKIEGKHIPISHLGSPGQYLSFTRPEPIGVVGQIIPWNFPLADGGLETGAGAGDRLHRGAESGGGNAAVRRCGWARFSWKRACPTAWSISCPASAKPPARRWRHIPASTRSPSPARPRSGS